MLGASSSGLVTSTVADGGGVIEVGASTGGVMEDSEKIGGGGGGNRWPREETLALLKIRSDMDAAFRNSSLKGPLWEEVSRKMAELGFQRSAKKCQEKFENVYKYHKRTKDGRASKSDGKTYRYFDQLEALDHAPPPPRPPPAQLPPPKPTSVTMALPINSSPNFQPLHSDRPIHPAILPQIHTLQPENLLWNSTSSSYTSSDEDIQRRRGKKRKWKDFFEMLMRDVIQKQEELQKKFLETLEKLERDRMAREEAWRVQEMARMNREREILAQERSTAAAKDAAVISFLQKISDNLQIPISVAPPMPPFSQATTPPQSTISPPIAAPQRSTLTPTKAIAGDNSIGGASTSRWPKAEVQALIQLRMNMEVKYQESGPKGPLWEEISGAMAKLGYSRSAKRCKEKWENINKYFKKVKESNKKRPEDSKTCPYYHLLDAIYNEKAKTVVDIPSFNLDHTMRTAENPTAPIMARPEQQWPQDHSAMPPDPDQDNNNGSEEGEDVDDDDDDDGDDDGGAGGYEIVANKPPPVTKEAD